MESPKEPPRESSKEEVPQSTTTTTPLPKQPPKKAKRSSKKPGRKVAKEKDIPKTVTAAPRKSMAETKAQKTIFNSQVHHEISMLLQAVKSAPYGPVLADIYDVYVAHKTNDDDFLRRQKNRIVLEATAERDAFEAITMEWSTQFESAVKKRISLLQTQAEAGAPEKVDAAAPEKTEEQLLKEQQDMDSGVNEVILKMLGQYQEKIKTSKKNLTHQLSKIEAQSHAKYEKGLAEEELHLLTLFRRLVPSIQMSAHPALPTFQTASIQNINPPEIRAKPDLDPEAVIANGDETKNENVEMGNENSPVKNLLQSLTSIKKRKIAYEIED